MSDRFSVLNGTSTSNDSSAVSGQSPSASVFSGYLQHRKQQVFTNHHSCLKSISNASNKRDLFCREFSGTQATKEMFFCRVIQHHLRLQHGRSSSRLWPCSARAGPSSPALVGLPAAVDCVQHWHCCSGVLEAQQDWLRLRIQVPPSPPPGPHSKSLISYPHSVLPYAWPLPDKS